MARLLHEHRRFEIPTPCFLQQPGVGKNPEGAMEKLMEGEPLELTPPDRKPALDEALELEAKITSLLEILQAEAGLPPQKRARG